MSWIHATMSFVLINLDIRPGGAKLCEQTFVFSTTIPFVDMSFTSSASEVYLGEKRCGGFQVNLFPQSRPHS